VCNGEIKDARNRHHGRVESVCRVHQEFIKSSPIYCCPVNRTYWQVVLLEAVIILGLVVLGRFFS
jgi:hypothetical protein